MSAVTSVTGSALLSAVEGLSARSRAIADNVANIQTPGFQSRRVAFEDAVIRAADQRRTGVTEHTTAVSLEPTRTDGNNVNLDTETLSHLDTGMRYQLTLRAIDDRFAVTRAALRTQG